MDSQNGSNGLEEVGTVIKKCAKGYGFIRRDEFPKKHNNAFFHATQVEGKDGFKKIKIGDRVIFNLSQIPKKDRAGKNPSAVGVRKIV